MKNLVKTIAICVAFSTIACNNDENNNETVEQNLVFENNNSIVLPDGRGSLFNDPVHTPGIATTTISVNQKGIIAKPWKVNISLELNYLRPEATVFQLYAPSGESCKIFEKVDCRFRAGNIITFNSGAVFPIAQNTYVATGNYLPSTGVFNGQADNLATFLEGQEIEGVWTLKITDTRQNDVDNPEDEKLLRWKLEFDRDALQ